MPKRYVLAVARRYDRDVSRRGDEHRAATRRCRAGCFGADARGGPSRSLTPRPGPRCKKCSRASGVDGAAVFGTEDRIEESSLILHLLSDDGFFFSSVALAKWAIDDAAHVDKCSTRL